MLQNPLLTLAATALLGATAAAQFCSDNLFPVRLVTADGTELPRAFDPVTGTNLYQAATESVYLAFDPTLASGTYYVHVTNIEVNEVLSLNDPMDRFVAVSNVNGVISLSLPFSSNPNLAVYGLGLAGQGQSLLLTPYAAPTTTPCRFKVLFGDVWDLSYGPNNPYLLAGGIHPVTGGCAVRSYDGFRIGSGSGSDVCGSVFRDSDHDGVRDPNETGAGGWEVRLVTATTAVATTTDAAGNYKFANVTAGSYTVELTLQSGFVVTTPASHAIEVCACAAVTVAAFGAAPQVLPCNARTIGYWRNKHGLALVQQYGMLSTLPALCLVNTCGQRVSPGSLQQFKCYLQFANSWNMAYMLSAQLVAMHGNLIAGFVHPDCVLRDPCLGTITVAQLVQQSIASLCAHPYTPPCSYHRWHQTKLKNALDRANNNLIWQ